jgi:hypothetical protein
MWWQLSLLRGRLRSYLNPRLRGRKGEVKSLVKVVLGDGSGRHP